MKEKRELEMVELRPKKDPSALIVITPLNRALLIEESAGNRFLNCRYHDGCLSYAVKKRFTSFSCRNCPIFKEKRRKLAGSGNRTTAAASSSS